MKPKEVLGTTPHDRERSIGAVKAGPSKNVGGQSKAVSGCSFADVSANKRTWSPSAGKSGNGGYKGKPGAG